MNYSQIIDLFYSAPSDAALRQTLLTHSRGVAELAMECIDSMPDRQLAATIDRDFVFAAAMLHDIGIIRCDAEGIGCHGTEPYICHGRLGAEMLRAVAPDVGLTPQEVEPYARVCERHTGAGLSREDIVRQNLPLPAIDLLPETVEEQLVCYADKFFSKSRPDVRKPFAKVERSLAKFGEEGLERFRRWARTFGALVLLLVALLMPVDGMAQVFEQMPVPDSVWQRMQGKSLPVGCTVDRSQLRYLRLSHYDAEGKVREGELVCNRKIASDLIEIFRELYSQKYPIGSMRLIDDYDADDERSMTANNTSCFCYRAATGSTKTLSRHALGMAVDVNPLYNPYVNAGRVAPAAGRKYARRPAESAAAGGKAGQEHPMMITRRDLCYRLFIEHGFRWGGAWRSCKDYQHFEK